MDAAGGASRDTPGMAVDPAAVRLYACVQCPQPAGRPSGPDSSFVERLAVGADRAQLALRKVHCLNGCPAPCTVALRAPGKWAYRLSGLAAGDVDDVIALARAYAAHPTGELLPQDWPGRLTGCVTVRTPPLSPRAPDMA